MAIVENTKAWIRKQFIDQTGRFDLVTDLVDYEDNGADFFIDAACRILDNMPISQPKSIQRYQADLSAGDFMINMKYLRSVEKVEVMNGDGRTELTALSYGDFREEYSVDMANAEQGTPTYYTLNVNSLSPEQKAITSANQSSYFTYDVDGLLFSDQSPYLYDGILIGPPADGTYTITIHARFYSILEDDSDKNYYSVNFPILLVLAAKLALYSMYDNSQGVQDTLRSMDIILSGIDINSINSEMARAGTARSGL